jgi:NADPH-dependent curcumin reductase
MEGFIVFDENMLRWSEHHRIEVGQLLANGQMLSIEDVTVGMENAVEAFLGVLQGENIGKAILQVSGPMVKDKYLEG